MRRCRIRVAQSYGWSVGSIAQHACVAALRDRAALRGSPVLCQCRCAASPAAGGVSLSATCEPQQVDPARTRPRRRPGRTSSADGPPLRGTRARRARQQSRRTRPPAQERRGMLRHSPLDTEGPTSRGNCSPRRRLPRPGPRRQRLLGRWRPARRRDREEGPQPPPRRRARRRQRLPRYAGFGDGLLLAISFSPSVG